MNLQFEAAEVTRRTRLHIGTLNHAPAFWTAPVLWRFREGRTVNVVPTAAQQRTQSKTLRHHGRFRADQLLKAFIASTA